MNTITIILEKLTTGRDGAPVSAPLDLTLTSGEALIVSGPNGAGKSTLLRTLAGLLPPFSGTARIEGARASDGEPATAIHEATHYLGHRNALKGASTLGANLAFWSRYLGGGGESVAAALEAVGLSGLSSLAVSHLSAGQQRRAALARLLLVPRPIWLLDEPTAALDASSQRRFAELAARHLAGGGIVVAATHQPLGLEGRRLDLVRAAPAHDPDGFA